PNPTIAASAVNSTKLAADPLSLTKLSGGAISVNNWFVGVGTSTPIGSGNFAVSQNTSSYGGMYVDTVPVNGFPFYGYSHNSVPIAYHYLDGGDNDTWKLINGGVLCLSATHSGKVGIGTSTPGYELDVADRIRVRQGPSGTAGMWLYQTAP